MWNPFRKKKVDIIDARVEGTRMMPDGYYEMVWDRRPMPTPGAMCFAWETLGLPKFNIIGTGIAARQPFGWQYPGAQLYVPAQSVPIQGIPIVAGQFVVQPLGQNPGGG